MPALLVAMTIEKQICFGQYSDEGYYYSYAAMMKDKGTSSVPFLFNWYSGSAHARLHPSPMRIGYTFLMGALFKIHGPSTKMMDFTSLASFLLLLLVCYYYAKKYFDPDTALLFVLLLGYSPLMVGLTMRGLIDSEVNLLWGLQVWLFYDYLTAPKRWKYVATLLLLTYSILFKESAVFFIPFMLVSALWLRRQAFAAVFKMVSLSVLIILLIYTLLLQSAGGIWIFRLIGDLVGTHLVESVQSDYAYFYCSGAWFKYLLDFFLVNPFIILLMFACLGYMAAKPKLLDEKIKYLLSYFIFFYAALSALPHSKVIRCVENLEMVAILLAAIYLLEAFKPKESPRGRLLLIICVLGILTYNFYSFLTIFYATKLLDPLSYHLLALRHLIRWDLPPFLQQL